MSTSLIVLIHLIYHSFPHLEHDSQDVTFLKWYSVEKKTTYLVILIHYSLLTSSMITKMRDFPKTVFTWKKKRLILTKQSNQWKDKWTNNNDYSLLTSSMMGEVRDLEPFANLVFRQKKKRVITYLVILIHYSFIHLIYRLLATHLQHDGRGVKLF